MDILNPRIEEYIEGAIPPRKAPFDEMEKYARENHFPIIGPLVGTVLKQVAYTIKARRIFELGSGYGYSALWMAQALPPDGKIFLTDRKEENRQMAIKHFEKAGLGDKMEFFVGDALEIFEKQKGPFDIILCDIDKYGYPDAIEPVKKRLRSGGYFITDNILWSGRIFNENPDKSTQGILEFTRRLYEDKDFLTSIIPLRDGISIAVKM